MTFLGLDGFQMYCPAKPVFLRAQMKKLKTKLRTIPEEMLWTAGHGRPKAGELIANYDHRSTH